LSHIQNAIIEKNEKGKLKIEPIKEEEIEQAIKNLKPGKSPDIDGISAEHYKNAMDELKPLILHILNTIIEELDIPQMLKRGIMTAVLKNNKDRQTSQKIIQSILKSRVDIQIDQIQNPLHRGFTEAIPILFAVFIASEVIIESSTNNDELLLLTLDAEKAFDKLNHEILFNKLYHNGIKGDMWVLLRNMHREMTTQVNWDNHLSENIYVNQSIQQGAKLSTSLYKCYNNAILDSVTEGGLGSHLGTISIATPTCADDILILANSECELQSIMDIIYHHTQRDLVKINPQKSDLICYNTSSERKVNIGDCKVSRSTCTKHLGISRNEKNSINIDEKLKSGRAAIYGMLGAGLQLIKGFSPLISHNLWKVYAVPKILYGLEEKRNGAVGNNAKEAT
jgi:hypothetical protein